MFNKVNRLTAATRRVPYLLVALPVVISFLYVYLFGISVVWNDQWEMVSYFSELSSGTLTVSDLWTQHNEHRFLFPRVAMLLLGTLTAWNTVAEMYLIQICLLITLITILFAFRASIGSRLLFFVPVAFLVFSLLQHYNMLWGYQLTFTFVETFGVLTFFFLQLLGCGSLKRFAFPAALASGTVAAFSAIQGLLVWPAGLLQLLIIPIDRSKKKLLVALWSLIGLVEWAVYFIDYTLTSNSPSVLYHLANPTLGARYFLTLLGSSLVPPEWQSLALIIGLVLASLVVVSLILTYKSGKVGEYSFWIALLLFSLLILGAITAGRSGSGVLNAVPPRYANFSILVVVSAYGILAKSTLERTSQATAVLFSTFLMIILLSVPISYYQGIQAGSSLERKREQAAFVLYTYRSQPDECLTLVRKNNTYTVRNLAPILEHLSYNVFAEPHVSPPRGLRCPDIKPW